ncbi:similar to Saccharomyces cerevisiae YMR274C RCE1 Type II CAAX prenyl protease involved in the proteolysis and maturation of Ras and the a-factor mating pheromone [Maudiozyma barnettii]|uniref:intramembrane prenyl-peptidase Rce1 n=1 Tax=Maudiozyma barnettii TaxID=61262 RepID=A0A8H2VC89_9SACH|nr:CAAX prenyl protease [Kazachstania barnettii]CAB4252630.1 similar to Saccharomyces cerevisiae YMR274C RCE1 Type II CAAX prenyl protease involved in the proteolysis and maturation of Ras and the a-factor mating pheromone [Kazachstania barnettii]CAD1780099.1 similar to Saccharomyces cerevisiae YMR274C RCE1 Type II CAAX prenyl protease involved in the proteolysis and maturation of Ras and the a-factor mating pheromone [Kazachstania barnettii]
MNTTDRVYISLTMSELIIGYTTLLYISASYVSVLYVSSRDAEQYKRKRDDPRVIKSRMQRISLLTLFNILVIPLLQTIFDTSGSSYISHVLNLGIIPCRQLDGQWDIKLYLQNCFESVILISQLYIGPITDIILYYIATKCDTLYADFFELFNNIWSIRNIIFAPITEELFYTSMLLTTYMAFFNSQHNSFKRLLLEPPLFFGIAHIHHGYETYVSGNSNILSILISTIFQMVYTSLFGILTNYIFIITHGNLLSCIALHSICNIIGFPNGSELVTYCTIIKPVHPSSNRFRLVQLWKKIYIGLLFVGILLFVKGLGNFS